MGTGNFKITKHEAPERCEICHQADMFDRQLNICHRCSSLPIPVEELANPVYVISPSTRATLVAAILATFCLIVGMLDINALVSVRFKMLMYYPASFYIKVFFLNVIGLAFSMALFHWCKDKYNERLTYQVVIFGRIASVVGIVGSGAGLLIPLPGIIMRF